MRLDLGRTGDERLHLAGDDLGQGDPVVLVHGWPGSARVWDDLRAELLAAGHRVISQDRRGFGRSGPPSSGYELDALAEDLARILTQLALQDVTLVGWDLGCKEIMRLLGMTGEDRIARVAFIAPRHRSGEWVEATRCALGVIARHRAYPFGRRPGLCRWCMPSRPHPGMLARWNPRAMPQG
jgi:pimeloyl-ACP methyl ester carboxylesterase